jgi:hypothetical protein
MKKFLLAIAVVAAAMGAGNVAQASFIFGSLDFNQTALVPSGTTQNLLTIGTFTTDNYASGSTRTDDFVSTPVGTPVTGLPLNTASLSTWGFSSASFGTFSALTGAQVFSSFIPGVGNIRSFVFSGTFTPGTLYPGKSGYTNNATVVLSFTQAGGANHAISSSLTLNVASAVPEPSTLALLGTLCGPLGLAWMRRRRTAK